jgi:succinate-acetate transporter protein
MSDDHRHSHKSESRHNSYRDGHSDSHHGHGSRHNSYRDGHDNRNVELPREGSLEPGVYPVASAPAAPAYVAPTTTVVTPVAAPVVMPTVVAPMPVPVETHHHHSEAVQTRVFLQPIAPPQPLGLWGFSIGTFICGAYLAGWFGTNGSLAVIAPFAFFAGGLLQLIALHFAFRARDAFSTVSFGIWSALWFAFATLWFMVLFGLVPPIFGNIDSFAIWWVPLAALSLMLVGAALLENLGVMLVYLFVFVASVLMAASYFWDRDDNDRCRDEGDQEHHDCDNHGVRLRKAAGYFFVFSALTAMYTGLWFLLSFMSGRDLVWVYRFRWAEKRPRIHGGENEPGVKKGL